MEGLLESAVQLPQVDFPARLAVALAEKDMGSSGVHTSPSNVEEYVIAAGETLLMRARDLLQACSWLPCLQEVDVQVVAQWDPACGVEAREQMNQKWQAMWQEEEMLRGLGGAILVLNMSLGPTFVDRQGAKEDKTNAELRRRGASARRAAARCKR
ncbi:unnamed protein product [Durusdinium trenchii]|uniref:Uncharacterized protein n=1 Tax=Durusdinium trenchii TaxID=1381693 RepID=A0ABP0P010_9DINO